MTDAAERTWGIPDLEPMLGCRPLDTYTGRALYCRLADGREVLDCPCGGHVPRGSRLVCVVCHRTGWEGLLAFLGRKFRLPRTRAYTGEPKPRPAGKKAKPKAEGHALARAA